MVRRLASCFIAAVAGLAAAGALADTGESPDEPAPEWPQPAARSLRYGLGVEHQLQPVEFTAAGGATTSATVPVPVLLIGVSVATGARSRLAWQAPLAVPGRSGIGGAAGVGGILGVQRDTSQQVQVAWRLRSRDTTLELLGSSSFKMALSNQTVVAIKPRLSKVSVTLQHRW